LFIFLLHLMARDWASPYKNQVKMCLWFCIFQSLGLQIGDEKTKRSELNDIKHSPNIIYFSFKCLFNVILICYSRCQTFELCRIFEGFITIFYIMTSFCILLTSKEHVFLLRFLIEYHLTKNIKQNFKLLF
jgi:hypothetical protein